jgi:hypothetical protein
MTRAKTMVLIASAIFVLLALAVHQISAGSYNRTGAVNYADAWAHGRNGNYPIMGAAVAVMIAQITFRKFFITEGILYGHSLPDTF